jgi:hypothetical protein
LSRLFQAGGDFFACARREGGNSQLFQFMHIARAAISPPSVSVIPPPYPPHRQDRRLPPSATLRKNGTVHAEI